MLTRRDVLIGSAATVAALSMPAALPAAAAAPPLVADMFYTPDEPWGAFVRTHVPKDQFEQAIRRMIDSNDDYRLDGEDWLFESHWDDDDNQQITITITEPEYLYMRVNGHDEEQGDLHCFCKAGDEGAIPITVVRY
jgi:hypothetical protein